ncbi:hypothetical protein DFP72DRAFT_995472 [Ephemerocybe angulata]|uniref:Uncharacterized protein n=1 Tax=Ephemerocybe angulata TaxID=980116 RepID=A0A8H6LT07_9AGAR|nr:hypothetical protein DFP72DRAFT_995472 [Tulosesus angulatus]
MNIPGPYSSGVDMDESTVKAFADMRGDEWEPIGGDGVGDTPQDGDGGRGEWVDIDDRMTAEDLARAFDAVTLNPNEAADLKITIETVDLYTLDVEAVIPRRDDQVTVVALAEAGYLGNSPVSPNLAISFKTLDLLKIIRQRRPSFSFEAFAKVLCDLYQTPYRRQWRIALADAFDVFLTIKNNVEARIASALGRDSDNWRVLNACAACQYELEKEPELRYRILMSLDGNNSAKRVDTRFRKAGDMRIYTSDYFLDNSEVDKFKLEDIPAFSGPSFSDTDVVSIAHEDDSASQSQAEVAECVKNWKAAQSDNKKRAMDMFDETGWFASGCRHGIILWVADMVRSGEQAKYPLSILNRALEVLGNGLLVGYDIGCAFEGTIKSTTLGTRFVESGSRCCVNAYHGYAHNYACQVKNHPNNIEGAGIEDLETMERFFSASNATAPVIRHASKYRRRMILDLFLKQHDKDKYATRDQAAYFATLGKVPEKDLHKVAYVELLEELKDAEHAAASKTSGFLNAISDDWDVSTTGVTSYEDELSRTRKLETMRRHAREKVSRLTQEVIEMELRMGITSRWTFATPEYQETKKYIQNRKYHKALDEIQRLVVQRLFELHRLGLSGVGYRARSLLTKALRTRSKAIKNAVARYNAAAGELEPPAPALDWSKIAKYNFVEEFSLLKKARHDVRPEPWSDGEVREAMKLHQRIKRAAEEIHRVNIEMRRLFTSIYDEHALFDKVRQKLVESNDHALLGALDDFVLQRTRVNRTILHYLEEIQAFDGYTGEKKLLGVRQVAMGDEGKPVEHLDEAYDTESEGGDDEDVAQKGGMLDWIGDIAVT